jgi:hypothetical protein
MIEKLNTISLGSQVFPFKCDNLVLEQLQDEFGTLDDFEKKLNGWVPVLDENGIQKKNDKGEGLFKVVEPSMKAINFSLLLMIREGVEIHNETAAEKIELPSDKALLRLIEQPLPVSKEIYEEYLNCFKVKNAKTTQGKKTVKKVG